MRGNDLKAGQYCPILKVMKGNEFIKLIQRLAKARGLVCTWRPDMGKGSHGVLTLGEFRTVVRNPKDEIRTGTYHAMLKQLGLTDKDMN